MIPNEPVMRNLKKLMIGQGHRYELIFKGTKQKMGRKQNIKDEDRKIAGTLKKVKKENPKMN